MTNPKTVEEVLERDLEKSIQGCINLGFSVKGIVDTIMPIIKAKYLDLLPEEQLTDFVQDGYDKDIGHLVAKNDWEKGFNSAIQETKRRMNELL
jgi:hypothetical protein